MQALYPNLLYSFGHTFLCYSFFHFYNLTIYFKSVLSKTYFLDILAIFWLYMGKLAPLYQKRHLQLDRVSFFPLCRIFFLGLARQVIYFIETLLLSLAFFYFFFCFFLCLSQTAVATKRTTYYYRVFEFPEFQRRHDVIRVWRLTFSYRNDTLTTAFDSKPLLATLYT